MKRATTAPLAWIAQRLEMGTRSTVSREVAAMGKILSGSRKLSQWQRKILEAAAQNA